MSDSIEHIGLPPKKEKKIDVEKEDKDSDIEDLRLWTPHSYGEYVGAIDKGNGWEPAVIIEPLSMDDYDDNYDDYVQVGED